MSGCTSVTNGRRGLRGILKFVLDLPVISTCQISKYPAHLELKIEFGDSINMLIAKFVWTRDESGEQMRNEYVYARETEDEIGF